MTTEPPSASASWATQTLRLPRGLLDDLETAVIQADRAFLTEVARSLGLPVKDVLRKCLGTGAPATIPVLWGPVEDEADEDEETETKIQCPWMDCKGKGLWSACPRIRLAPTLACAVHIHARAGPTTRLATDPVIRAVSSATPIEWRGCLYWVNFEDPDTNSPVFREDGTLEPVLRFRYRDTGDGRKELVVESRSGSGSGSGPV